MVCFVKTADSLSCFLVLSPAILFPTPGPRREEAGPLREAGAVSGVIRVRGHVGLLPSKCSGRQRRRLHVGVKDRDGLSHAKNWLPGTNRAFWWKSLRHRSGL